jgi:hypothetical protein
MQQRGDVLASTFAFVVALVVWFTYTNHLDVAGWVFAAFVGVATEVYVRNRNAK